MVNENSSTAPLVCFDLGGVIVRICRSWEEGCRAAGVPWRERPASPEEESARRDLVRELTLGRIDASTFFAELAGRSRGVYSPEEIERVHHAWILGEYPGVTDLIDRLHDAGARTACLSNTNHAHWERLVESPAIERLQERHASHLLGLAKPDEAIYRAFEQRVGVDSAGVLFFDDLEENIHAARALGWRAVQVDPHGDTAEQMDAALRAAGVLAEPE